jgi:hypothetical protein
MTGLETFRADVPALLEAARASDPNLSILARQAMRGLAHWDLPIGIKVEDAWIGLLPKKLEGVNRWMSDWRLRSSMRKKWGTLLWNVICAGERVASRAGVVELGRAPHCTVKMAVQVVRFVPSVRQFLRDDDSLAGSPKQLYDALKDVGLIREDRREWLQMLPVCQDVSPIADTAVTMFLLWPAPVAGLLRGAESDVHRAVRPATHCEGVPEDRGTEEGRAVPGVRRRVGPRAVDV